MRADFESPRVDHYMKSRRSAFSTLTLSILFAAVLPHGHAAPAPLPDEPGRILWTNSTRGPVSSPALSPDGLTLYVSSADRHLYAFDAITGDIKWTNRFPGTISPPVLNDDGLIYVGCSDGR